MGWGPVPDSWKLAYSVGLDRVKVEPVEPCELVSFQAPRSVPPRRGLGSLAWGLETGVSFRTASKRSRAASVPASRASLRTAVTRDRVLMRVRPSAIRGRGAAAGGDTRPPRRPYRWPSCVGLGAHVGG